MDTDEKVGEDENDEENEENEIPNFSPKTARRGSRAVKPKVPTTFVDTIVCRS
jgi:hypothetical protein